MSKKWSSPFWGQEWIFFSFLFFSHMLGGNLLFRQVKCHLKQDWGFNTHFSHRGLVFRATFRCSFLRILWFIAMLTSSLHFPYKHLMRLNTWTWQKCAWNLSDNSLKVNNASRTMLQEHQENITSLFVFYASFPFSCESEMFLVIIWEPYNGCNL